MAGIDYTSLIMTENDVIDHIDIGPYKLKAYKYWLELYGKDERLAYYISSEKSVREIPEASNIRTIKLYTEADIRYTKKCAVQIFSRLFRNVDMTSKKTGKTVRPEDIFRKHIDLIVEPEEIERYKLIIFRIADSEVLLFPNHPEWGGATYAYVLTDDDRLSIIATGYGHEDNATLHWLNRGLPDEAEKALAEGFWKQMTSPYSFPDLILGQVFLNKKRYADGGFICGGFTRDTLTDKSVLRLYELLRKRRERCTY